MRKLLLGVAAASLSLVLAGCVRTVTSGPIPVDGAGRVVADSVATAVVGDRPAEVFALMESGFRSSMSTQDAVSTLEPIIRYGGHPLRATFKQAMSGSQSGPAGSRSTTTYWYLLDTGGSKGSPWYLKVDVVADGDHQAAARVSVVNFPVNGPPEDLK